MKTEKEILKIKRNIKRLGEAALIDLITKLANDGPDWIAPNSVVKDLKEGKTLDYILTDQEDREHFEKTKPEFELSYGFVLDVVKKKKHPKGKDGVWFWIEFGYIAGCDCGDSCEFWVQKIENGKLIIDEELPSIMSVF